MFNAVKVKDEIIQWIRGYFEENGKTAGQDCIAVVGISGGKDSSITAALNVQALGKDRVLGVLMPYGEQYDINVWIASAGNFYDVVKHCTAFACDDSDALDFAWERFLDAEQSFGF